MLDGKFNHDSEGHYMSDSRIKEHMEVIGADGVHIGTVDRVEAASIDETKPIGVHTEEKPNCSIKSEMSGSSAMKSTNAFVIAPRMNPNASSPSPQPSSPPTRSRHAKPSGLRRSRRGHGR